MTALARFTMDYEAAFAQASRAIFLHFANISLRHRYIYFATPKVACSTLLQTLQRLELDDPFFVHNPPAEIHHRDLSPLLAPLQVGSFKALADDPGIFTFCFVRNPYDRLLSCYLEKVRSGHLTGRFLQKLGRSDGPVEFEEFVSVIETETTEEMEPHYGVQFLQTFQDYIPYDLVGRFETFEQDLEQVEQRIGVDLGRYYARVDPHRTGKKPFQTLITPALQKRIEALYALDFERFDYSTTLPPEE